MAGSPKPWLCAKCGWNAPERETCAQCGSRDAVALPDDVARVMVDGKPLAVVPRPPVEPFGTPQSDEHWLCKQCGWNRAAYKTCVRCRSPPTAGSWVRYDGGPLAAAFASLAISTDAKRTPAHPRTALPAVGVHQPWVCVGCNMWNAGDRLACAHCRAANAALVHHDAPDTAASAEAIVAAAEAARARTPTDVKWASSSYLAAAPSAYHRGTPLTGDKWVTHTDFSAAFAAVRPPAHGVETEWDVRRLIGDKFASRYGQKGAFAAPPYDPPVWSSSLHCRCGGLLSMVDGSCADCLTAEFSRRVRAAYLALHSSGDSSDSD